MARRLPGLEDDDRDDPVGLALAVLVEDRRDARLAAAPADVVQDQDRRALEAAAQPASAGPVDAHAGGRQRPDQQPDGRRGPRRRHTADSMVRAGRMLDRIALRDTWQVVAATRAL